jgi:hypothetical protein
MNSDSVWNVQKVPVNIGALSVKENLYTSLFQIYPNPARDVLEVVLINSYDLKADDYAIINTMGQIVKEGSILKEKTVNTFSINVSDLNNGVYYVRLFLKDSYLYKKVIIAK